MNEHLTEALRRIKKNSGDENVDRYVLSLSTLPTISTGADLKIVSNASKPACDKHPPLVPDDGAGRFEAI